MDPPLTLTAQPAWPRQELHSSAVGSYTSAEGAGLHVSGEEGGAACLLKHGSTQPQLGGAALAAGAAADLVVGRHDRHEQGAVNLQRL